jgi:hypothetical protein
MSCFLCRRYGFTNYIYPRIIYPIAIPTQSNALESSRLHGKTRALWNVSTRSDVSQPAIDGRAVTAHRWCCSRAHAQLAVVLADDAGDGDGVDPRGDEFHLLSSDTGRRSSDRPPEHGDRASARARLSSATASPPLMSSSAISRPRVARFTTAAVC